MNDLCKVAVELGAVDMIEIYTPKRFTAMAPKYGLRPGFAVDLNETKPDSDVCWDLEKPEDVKELEIRVDQEEPYVLMGSPPCDPFSRLQAILRRSRDPDAYEKMGGKGKHHLKTATDFYWRQLRAGRFFLH